MPAKTKTTTTTTVAKAKAPKPALKRSQLYKQFPVPRMAKLCYRSGVEQPDPEVLDKDARKAMLKFMHLLCADSIANMYSRGKRRVKLSDVSAALQNMGFAHVSAVPAEQY